MEILVELLELLDSETWIPVECAEKISALKEKAIAAAEAAKANQ